MKQGSIVLIPFPFAELSNIKLRPALLVSFTKDKFQDLVLCAISSSVPDNLGENDIIIEPDHSNGLRKKSVLKADRIVTLKSNSVVAVIGKLSAENWSDFREVFKSLVD